MCDRGEWEWEWVGVYYKVGAVGGVLLRISEGDLPLFSTLRRSPSHFRMQVILVREETETALLLIVTAVRQVPAATVTDKRKIDCKLEASKRPIRGISWRITTSINTLKVVRYLLVAPWSHGYDLHLHPTAICSLHLLAYLQIKPSLLQLRYSLQHCHTLLIILPSHRCFICYQHHYHIPYSIKLHWLFIWKTTHSHSGKV